MSNLAKRVGKIGVSAAISGLAVLLISSSAFAAQGSATITDPSHATTLTSGTTSTPFSFALPAGAHCQHDGSNGTTIYSFLVQEQASPAATAAVISGLTYTGGFASQGYFMADTSGTPFPGATPQNGTAIISPLPQWTSGGLLAAGIPASGAGGLVDPSAPLPGVWEAGVACTLAGVVQDFWNVQITFDANAGWTTPGAVTPESPLAVGLPIGGAAVVAGGVVINTRRRRARRAVAAA